MSVFSAGSAGSALTARGETPAAFGRRCIPADCVAPPSNIPDILGRRALSSGRLAGLGATPDFHHGLLIGARRWPRSSMVIAVEVAATRVFFAGAALIVPRSAPGHVVAPACRATASRRKRALDFRPCARVDVADGDGQRIGGIMRRRLRG